MNIYVGNLSYSATEEDLKVLFGQHGEVASVNIVTDRYSGQSKGFGFVEMPEDQQAQTAISELDGYMFKGRSLKVNKARPREERPRQRRW